jgi:hypothetical protein
MVLDGRKGDAGAALGTLEKTATVLVVTQQVVRGKHDAVTEGAENVSHGRLPCTGVASSIWRITIFVTRPDAVVVNVGCVGFEAF